jgi:hypothetical protein
LENKADLLYTSTNTRINEKWVIKNDQLRETVDSYPANLKFKNFIDRYSTNQMDNELYQQCFLQVVTETVYNYPVAFFSEKTAKPLLNKRPFVILGPVGSLLALQELGFKTFSAYWSEEYDKITDLESRMLAVVDIMEWVCAQSVDDLQSLCTKMEDVLNYNFNYYVNEFKNKELTKFEQACIENLKPRYD